MTFLCGDWAGHQQGFEGSTCFKGTAKYAGRCKGNNIGCPVGIRRGWRGPTLPCSVTCSTVPYVPEDDMLGLAAGSFARGACQDDRKHLMQGCLCIAYFTGGAHAFFPHTRPVVQLLLVFSLLDQLLLKQYLHDIVLHAGEPTYSCHRCAGGENYFL